MKTILNLISFGGNHLVAIFFYVGASLLLLGITPDLPSVHAANGCGGEATCQTGYTCCDGECVPEGECCTSSTSN
jgi:hypothetical protein